MIAVCMEPEIWENECRDSSLNIAHGHCFFLSFCDTLQLVFSIAKIYANQGLSRIGVCRFEGILKWPCEKRICLKSVSEQYRPFNHWSVYNLYISSILPSVDLYIGRKCLNRKRNCRSHERVWLDFIGSVLLDSFRVRSLFGHFRRIFPFSVNRA